ncbi:UNVERIFIED_CONTAM: hypothetical protein Sradi_3282100 [Sesamum radiatum]|uniref:Uncharacterized protein n=1 Tax=Sesamum radiatum TaxID=300843 RepID=A0AAW2R1C6_SESRA
MVSSSQPADVIALSKVTCLVLPNEHTNLLKPKSIWSADETQEKLPLVEQILHLDPVDLSMARAIAQGVRGEPSTSFSYHGACLANGNSMVCHFAPLFLAQRGGMERHFEGLGLEKIGRNPIFFKLGLSLV